MPWNYGDLMDVVASAVPADTPAFIHADRVITWGESTRRSNNLARALIERSAKPGDKLAFYMRNRSEYMEGVGASFRARMTHVNVNYRYKPDEVWYIFDNSDAQTVIYSSEFRDTVEKIRDRLPKVQTYIEVSSDGTVASFAESYETLANTGDGSPLDIRRMPDDMFFIYTGGTTGMPKGVMWEQGVMCRGWHDSMRRANGQAPASMEAFADNIRKNGGTRILPACPLMHGTGLLASLAVMLSGGSIVTVENPTLDPHEIWALVDKHRVQVLVIVGDAFGKPLLRALDEEPGKYDLSNIVSVNSSGAMWSVEVKKGFLQHMPQAVMSDGFGSSENFFMGTSLMTKDGEMQTAKFKIGETAKVFDENDQLIAPGSGQPGLIAVAGPMPAGYYKDPEKTAKTFRYIAGERYTVAGDFCIVEVDGTLTLLGRGSNCINTAGEKVYPEEVEEVLKTHPSVEDALVIGVPDDKWGQAVTGIVKIAPGAEFDEQAVRAHVRDKLAGYKTPKRILVGGTISLRAPNGKADYKSVTDFARRELGIA